MGEVTILNAQSQRREFWTFSRDDKLRNVTGMTIAIYWHEKTPLCDVIGIRSQNKLKMRNISVILSMFHQFI